MKKMTKRITLLLVGFFAASHVIAGLLVTPARQELEIPAGGKTEGKCVVKNNFDKTITVKASVKNWFILPENSSLLGQNWMAVSPTDFSLKPGEEKEVRCAVSLSTGVKGVSVGMISFVPASDSEVSMMVSVSLYAIAADTEKIGCEISDVKLSKDQDELRFSASVKNRGNIHLRPEGVVKIFKNKKEIFGINFKEGRPVYPGQSRSFDARGALPPGLKNGTYSAVIVLRAQNVVMEKKIKFKIKKNGQIVVKSKN